MKKLKNTSAISAFTMIELLVVIAIITIMAAMAMPSFYGWQTSINATSAADNLAANLLYARMQAITKRNNFVVTFDATANTYSIYNDINNDGPQASELQKTVALPDIKMRYGCNASFGAWPSQATSCPSNGISYNPLTVNFNSKGAASGSGYIFLIPTGDFGKENRNMKAIEINSLTGSVRSYSCCPWK